MSVTIGSISAALLGKRSRHCVDSKVQTYPNSLHEAKDECCPYLIFPLPIRYHMPLSLQLQSSYDSNP